MENTLGLVFDEFFDWRDISDSVAFALSDCGLLAKCSRLGLNETVLSARGLERVVRASEQLRCVYLDHCTALSRQVASSLASLHGKSLAELSLSHATLDRESIATILRQCGHLRRLDLTGQRLVDCDLVKLLRAPHLARLALNDCSVGNAGFEHIVANCTELESLGVSGCALADAGNGLHCATPLRMLMAIGLQGNLLIGHQTIRAVARAGAALKAVYLGHCPLVSNMCVQVLVENCPHIEDLDLEGTSVGNAGVAAVARFCPNLQFLGLGDTLLTGDGAAVLSCCQQLTELDLQNTATTDFGVIPLALSLSALDELVLSGTQVSSALLEPPVGPGSLPSLQSLYLGGLDIKVATLSRFLRDHPSVSIVGLPNLSRLEISTLEAAYPHVSMYSSSD